MSNKAYSQWLMQAGFGIELYVQSGLTANYSLALPNVAPTNAQSVRWNSATSAFEWFTPSAGNAGTVTSVGLALPATEFTITNSPVTGAGTLTGAWQTQAANRVLSSPNGAAGVPTFRTLVNADIPSGIDAAKITGVFAKANIPNGTSATTFQLGTGVTLVDDSGSLKICGADGTTVMDLTLRNLVITGNVDTQSSTNTNIGDSQLTMVSNYAGSTPTTDVNFTVERGTLTNASLRWNETLDIWQTGIDDNQLAIARSASQSFTNTDISGGTLIFTHNLRATNSDPDIVVKRNDGQRIMLGVSYTSANSATIDFSRVGVISGTWRVSAFS